MADMSTFKMVLDLPTPLVADLDTFCAYHYGAPRSPVIRQAIQHFLEYESKADPKLAKMMAEARVERAKTKGKGSAA
jgi:metal-responsive CopG/Arc/MetJ family transcriptional regulator